MKAIFLLLSEKESLFIEEHNYIFYKYVDS